jgi:hypothetical protein
MGAALAEDEHPLSQPNSPGPAPCDGDLAHGAVLEISETADVDEPQAGSLPGAHTVVPTESP